MTSIVYLFVTDAVTARGWRSLTNKPSPVLSHQLNTRIHLLDFIVYRKNSRSGVRVANQCRNCASLLGEIRGQGDCTNVVVPQDSTLEVNAIIIEHSGYFMEVTGVLL